MPNIFDFHESVLNNFEHFSRSFTTIRAEDNKNTVDAEDLLVAPVKQYLLLHIVPIIANRT